MTTDGGFDLGNLQKKLDELRLLKGKEKAESSNTEKTVLIPAQTTHYPGIVTSEQYARSAQVTDLEEQCRAFLNKKFVISDPPEAFAKLPNFTKDLRVIKYEFPDTSCLGQIGIRIFRISDMKECVDLGRTVIPMMTTGFSRQGAAALFLLAYNVKVPGGANDAYPYGDVTDIEQLQDKDFTDFPKRIMTQGVGLGMITAEGSEPESEAAYYCFIAATLLRLFTKHPSSYIRAWPQIKANYKKIYHAKLPVDLPEPSESVLNSLAIWFSSEVAKQTLYRLLYLGADRREHAWFRDFLFESHLAHTGMHIVPIFVQLCTVLNCSTGMLLQAVNVNEFAKPIHSLCELLKLFNNKIPGHEKRLWRFGRIFDHTFMAPLQTKSCAKLVYIFASILREENPKSYARVLEIKQLEDIGDETKLRCIAVGKKISNAIRSKVLSGN